MAGRMGMVWKSTPRALFSPPIKELYWAAGFLEGEGCFNKSRTSERVTANQVEREPLTHLVAMFGGRLRLAERRGNNQPIYTWEVNGARARGVAWTLYPLLSTKRQEAIRKFVD